ncbi:MAG TPA: NAD-dependent deacetylase, partial [Rhodoglobus sp.]|nr:NAD-dependent deacetylase [Rhodoglobus sp.]
MSSVQSLPAELSSPLVEAAVTQAVDALRGRRIAVLTGAGVSTDSGIPDYRGE